MSLSPDQKLSPRLTVRDLTKSSTADSRGISNMPPEDKLSSLKSLASTVEEMWNKFGGITIHSAFRTPEVNSAVGGSSTSKHMSATALDFTPTSMSITDYWLKLISDPFAKKLGEISLKPDQNSIHITLPYWGSAGYVSNSPRVKEGSGYYKVTTDAARNTLAKLGIVLSDEDLKTIAKVGGIGVGVLALGGGALLLALALRKRK